MTDQASKVSQIFAWHGLHFMESRFLEDGGRRLHFAVSRNWNSNTKPTIVFLHGVLRDWRSFYPLLILLEGKANLVSIDFRGHGQSEATGPDYLVTDYVHDAVRLLNSLEGQVYLYGHSLGAMVAFATAACVPERITTIILEDPPFETMGQRLRGTGLMNYFRSVEVVVRNELTNSEARFDMTDEKARVERLFEAFSNIAVGTDNSGNTIRIRDQRDEKSRRFSAESLARVDPEVFAPITSGQWLDGYDLTKASRSVTSRVVTLRADAVCGGMLTEDDANALIQESPGRREELYFSGVGHSMHWTKPKEIADLILSHLR